MLRVVSQFIHGSIEANDHWFLLNLAMKEKPNLFWSHMCWYTFFIRLFDVLWRAKIYWEIVLFESGKNNLEKKRKEKRNVLQAPHHCLTYPPKPRNLLRCTSSKTNSAMWKSSAPLKSQTRPPVCTLFISHHWHRWSMPCPCKGV